MTCRDVDAVRPPPSAAVHLQLAAAISALGSRVTDLALPLAALLVLDAGPLQVGVLTSASLAPHLVLGLPAGAWVERMRPKRLMVVCDAVCAAAIASVPVAAGLAVLSYAQLLVVALVVGSFTVLGDIAAASYLPRLVGLDALVTARSRLTAGVQLADVAGRPLGGLLVTTLGAARASAADALSYLLSLALLWRLPEMAPTSAPGGTDTFSARLRSGAAFAWRNPVNRRITIEAAHYNLFYQALVVVFLVHASDDLGWSGTQLGLAFGASSLGAVLGSTVAPRLSRRWGIGPVIVRALLVADAATLLLPVVLGEGRGAVALVSSTFAVIGAGSLISGVLAGSLNRMVTPEESYARVVGANKVLTRGGTALGGLLGGLLVAHLPPPTAVVVCAVGMCSAMGWVLTRRIASVRTVADAQASIGSPAEPAAPAPPQ